MPMLQDDLLGLFNRKALVLGAGQGIGEGIALLLARAGVHVALVDQEAERATAVAERARTHGVTATVIAADVRDDERLVRAIGEADQAHGGLDILVTVVGMATFKPALALTMQDWDDAQWEAMRKK